MQEIKIKANNAYLAEVQNNYKLIQQIQKYENQSLTTHMLVEAKKSIWHKINANITKLWSSIQIIFEQEELVQNVKAAIEQTNIEANRIIKMLNSKTK